MLRVLRKLIACWRLSWGERYLLLQAAWLLPVIAITLSQFGFKSTQRYLMKWSAETGSDFSLEHFSLEHLVTAKRTAHLVNQIARCWFPVGNCLKQSLTLWFLLRRRGINSALRVGVRRHEGDFQAHAWVEYGGCVVNDLSTIAQHYSVFEERFEAFI